MANKAIIVVPAQANDIGAFADVGRRIKQSLYPARETSVVLARMTVPDKPDVADVAYAAEGGGVFRFEAGADFDAFMILAHIGLVDGPNINYWQPNDPRAFQPWGQTREETPKGREATGVLTERGQRFWSSVGQALQPKGIIMMLGCKIGLIGCTSSVCFDKHNGGMDHEGHRAVAYAQMVANASKRTTYGPKGSFGAGDHRVCPNHVSNMKSTGADPYFNRYDPGPSPVKVELQLSGITGIAYASAGRPFTGPYGV